MKWYTPDGRSLGGIQVIEMCVTFDPEIPLLGMCLTHTPAHIHIGTHWEQPSVLE